MSEALLLDRAAAVLSVFTLIAASFILSRRDLLALVSTYRFQSLLVSAIALLAYLGTGSPVPLVLALLTLFGKVFLIPWSIVRVHRRMWVRRDSEFHYLSPSSAIFASILLMLVVYVSVSRLFRELHLRPPLVLGMVTGLSLAFIGVMVAFSRRQTITKILGYLTVENGVLLIGLFLTELPLLVEALVLLDSVMLVLLATVMAFGIDSTLEEFQERLVPSRRWLHPGEER